ncbi:MAG: hypothetical protein KME40_13505, partial [Komarekiella atlantica HA4396-MV6]|nr:hypothetical protein [Komarekiella atlantica HA4396-MV6]
MSINIKDSELKENIQLDTLTHLIGGQVIQELNYIQILDYQNLCIHQMFEIQAERSPDTIAVVFENT